MVRYAGIARMERSHRGTITGAVGEPGVMVSSNQERVLGALAFEVARIELGNRGVEVLVRQDIGTGEEPEIVDLGEVEIRRLEPFRGLQHLAAQSQSVATDRDHLVRDDTKSDVAVGAHLFQKRLSSDRRRSHSAVPVIGQCELGADHLDDIVEASLGDQALVLVGPSRRAVANEARCGQRQVTDPIVFGGPLVEAGKGVGPLLDREELDRGDPTVRRSPTDRNGVPLVPISVGRGPGRADPREDHVPLDVGLGRNRHDVGHQRDKTLHPVGDEPVAISWRESHRLVVDRNEVRRRERREGVPVALVHRVDAGKRIAQHRTRSGIQLPIPLVQQGDRRREVGFVEAHATGESTLGVDLPEGEEHDVEPVPALHDAEQRETIATHGQRFGRLRCKNAGSHVDRVTELAHAREIRPRHHAAAVGRDDVGCDERPRLCPTDEVTEPGGPDQRSDRGVVDHGGSMHDGELVEPGARRGEVLRVERLQNVPEAARQVRHIDHGQRVFAALRRGQRLLLRDEDRIATTFEGPERDHPSFEEVEQRRLAVDDRADRVRRQAQVPMIHDPTIGGVHRAVGVSVTCVAGATDITDPLHQERVLGALAFEVPLAETSQRGGKIVIFENVRAGEPPGLVHLGEVQRGRLEPFR